jgi:hypothetical protein
VARLHGGHVDLVPNLEMKMEVEGNPMELKAKVYHRGLLLVIKTT